MLGNLLKNSGLNNFKFENANLSAVLSPLLQVAFLAAAFLTFAYLVWGAFQYITASGQKENLAKARARITWAIVGLIVVLLAYLVITFGSEIFPSKTGVPF